MRHVALVAAGLCLAALVAVDLVGRALAARRIARANRELAGELAFHRHELRAIDRRAERRRAEGEAHLAELTALLDRPRSCGCGGDSDPDPEPLEMEEPAAMPGPASAPSVRPARPSDGEPDAVHRAVWRAIAADPRAIGSIVYVTDPCAPWRPMVVTLPGDAPRPAVMITMWGRA